MREDEIIYRDEPIARTGIPQIPPAYREMRKLDGYRNYGFSDAMVFRKQAKFMENFEDDHEFQGEFTQHFPNYQAMNDRQLRGYFTWRTRTRQGNITETQLSFVFVYLYELLNRIGVSSVAEGFATLRRFWQTYREIDSRIDRYAKLWLKDYVVYYGLDRSLLAELVDSESDRAARILLDYEAHCQEEVFRALVSLSNYKLENSAFFKQHPEAVRQVVCNVFGTLAGRSGRNVCETLFGKLYTGRYTMFRSALFHDPERRPERVYEVDDGYRYMYKDGKWSCEKFLCYTGKAQMAGALLKTIDFLMRREYGYQSSLKVEAIPEIYRDIICGEIAAYRKTLQPRVEIDFSKLDHIRKNSLETQSKLIVEEAEEHDAPPPPEPVHQSGLGDLEYRFLRCLLYGGNHRELLKSAGVMPSLLIDSVNEALFERFGDTVLAGDENNPEILEDYLDELKGMIEE